jgi:hypothetical protein
LQRHSGRLLYFELDFARDIDQLVTNGTCTGTTVNFCAIMQALGKNIFRAMVERELLMLEVGP